MLKFITLLSSMLTSTVSDLVRRPCYSDIGYLKNLIAT